MRYSSHYATGTVSVTAGSATVTGVSTSWVGKVRPGDILWVAGFSCGIATVDSNTSLTLRQPWPGADATDASYEAWIVLDAIGYQKRVGELVDTMASGNNSALAGLVGEAGMVPVFTGPGVMELAELAAAAVSGDYEDLLNKPELSEAALSGEYSDLLNRPVLGTAAAADASAFSPAGAVSFTPQALTSEQQQQSRVNLGIRSELPAYTGLVASPTRICTAKHSTNKVMMSRVKHRARDRMQSVSLVFANVFVGSPSGNHPLYEVDGTGSIMTLAASIEYPRGIYNRCRFSGSLTNALAAGAIVSSDLLNVDIPEGAEFWVRTWQDAGAGTIIYHSAPAFPTADDCASEFGAAGSTSDKTNGGTITGSIASSFGPVAIIGQTKKPTWLVLGDSREQGTGEVMTASLDVGTIGRSIGAEFAYINAGRAGDRASELAASNAMRVALGAYCSHIAVQHGTNDIASVGTSATGTRTLVEGIVALYPGKPVFIVTIEPHGVTSSDAYATLAGQVAHATNAVRVAYNGFVRAGTVSGAAGYFEIADALESSRNSGLWKVNGLADGYTADGIHASASGYALVQSIDALGVSRFRPIVAPYPRPASGGMVVAGSDQNSFISPAALKEAGLVFIDAQGTGPDGAWIKYSDGTLECEHTVTTTAASVAFGQLFRTSPVTWTFPVAPVGSFHYSASILGASGGGAGEAYMQVSFGVAQQTSVNLALMRATVGAVTHAVGLRMVGRWR